LIFLGHGSDYLAQLLETGLADIVDEMTVRAKAPGCFMLPSSSWSFMGLTPLNFCYYNKFVFKKSSSIS